MGTSGWSAKASSVRGNSAIRKGSHRGRSRAQDPAERDHHFYRSSFDAELHHIEMQPRQCGTFEPMLGAIGISAVSEGAYHPFLMRLASTINSSGS
jgi:hypothetical protein